MNTSSFGYFNSNNGPSPVNVVSNLFTGFSAPVDKHIQSQLVNVYKLLAGGLASATLGALFSMYTGFGGFLTLIATFGFLIALMSSAATAENESYRIKLFHGFTVSKGMTLGPLLSAIAFIDPGLIVTALGGTALIFGCFTVAALFADRRSFLFLGGLLGSGISLLMWMSFLNIFFHSPFASLVQIYLGLVIFSGYVLFDTQVIIETAARGPIDHITAALNLFIDFIAIFVRILIILSQNSNSKKKSNNRR